MKITSFLLIYLLVFLSCFKLIAQEAPVKTEAEPINPAVEEIRMGLKSDFQLIFFSGLGGAVLGLSTLSFVDKPSRELRRISYGFALGAIASSIYVLYKTTSKSMRGGGLSQGLNKRDIQPPKTSDEPSEEQYYDDREDDDYDDYYDDDFYGNHNSLFLISSRRKGLKINFPLFEILSEEEKGFAIHANLFKMKF